MPHRARSTVAERVLTGKRSLVFRIVSGLVLLAVLATLIGLGNWQVQRLAWKDNLLASIAERRSAPPVPLSDIETMLAAGQDIEYRTTTVTGTFDHTKERHFLATYDGESGFYVYTPLILTDGRTLFVNRGFVPYDRKDAATRPQGQTTGAVTISGLARAKLLQKPSAMVPDNDPAKNIFYWKDLDIMAATDGLDATKVVPLFLDADATPNPGGLPVGAVTQIDLPNSHLQYAVTWYGLAAALVLVSGVFVFRKKG
ncbi:SURF1 family protein [Pararhizobium sp.]|uniref:SURF1 family protein n=1 Tax=Pararhizobium sp. TaxID=1977563 RepID=UPI002726F61E|nr:SURF1 family protein [Pararhizobium sp.]MDO9415767.1 SURF1 family protein [Pararhizobium sp.]